MITVTVHYVTDTGQIETEHIPVAADTVWAAFNAARPLIDDVCPDARIVNVTATGPK
ncbi:hypothetical protein ABZ905_37075 [Streptomyces parvus]|uniref:hypothetical protein n=1 Tax=Streptomyces parvus TaxID=66428 RepID=UPI0033F6480F